MYEYKKTVKKDEKNLVLYIPCYDIINKEIYFFDFFNEEIVDLKSIDLSVEGKQFLNMNQDNANVNQNNADNINVNLFRNNTNNFNDFIKVLNPKKYLPRFLTLEENNKLEKYLDKFGQNWEKMKIITKFNAISSLGGEYKNYFRRPYYSRFFLSENLKLYSFNSTTNIPPVLKNCKMKIAIYFNKEPYLEEILTPENLKLLDLDKHSYNPDSVSLTTIVDSLIKETVDFFYNHIKDRIKDDEIITKLRDKTSPEKKNIFLLKFKENEEYLFGDSLIGAYQNIRGKLRQQETIIFYLKILPLHKVSPPIMSFPPIIRATDTSEKTYIKLLKKYLQYYSYKNGIIYRLLRPEEKTLKRFLKQKYKRIEKLSRFTESCDCCYPLWIKVKNLNNIYSLKYWFEDEEYNKNEILIPNLKFFELKKAKKDDKDNIKRKETNVKSDEKDPEKSKDSAKNRENEDRKKSLTVMSKKSERDNSLQKLLNRLSVTVSLPKYLDYSYNAMVSTNSIFGELIADCVDILSTSEDILNSTSTTKNVLKVKKVSATENRREYNKNKDQNYEESNITENVTFNFDNLSKDKYKVFTSEKYQLPFSPSFLRIKVSLLYGSYSILSFRSEPFLFENRVNLNDKFIFDNSKCLISNLPFETRIAVAIEAYEKTIKKYFHLGSCQIPLYRSDGQIQSGHIKINIWPNISVSPRFNNCSSFGLSTKRVSQIDDLEEGTYPEEARNYKAEILEKIEHDFKRIIKIYNTERTEKEKEESIDSLIKKFEEKKKAGDQNQQQNYGKNGHINNEQNDNQNVEMTKMKSQLNIIEENDKKKDEETEENTDKLLFKNDKSQDYCSISLEFPAFSSPMIYSQNCSQSYRDYLQIKYKKNTTSQTKNEPEDDFEEIRKLYGNSQKDIKSIVDDFKASEFSSDESKLVNNKNNNINNRYKENEYENNYSPFSYDDNQNNIIETYPKHIWSYIKKAMPLIVKILKKDPLDKLEESEITSILICRDYISTIPSALELFLRAIDWLNPLQVSIAHLYIKKWAKLQVEDAISLLDARFPDTETREFAVTMLRDSPDELINMYMLQLCQCLLYETFIVNPLSDFLIERSLMNPKLIGNAFFWNSRVSMKNPLFLDRLTIYLLTLLMYSGETFLDSCFNGVYFNDYLEFMTYYIKMKKLEGGNPTVNTFNILSYFSKNLKMRDFTFPIDPTYFGTEFVLGYIDKDGEVKNGCKVFNSKMLPTKLLFLSREEDKKSVIFKIGDDLRQDVLTLQIFSIMDKLWLEGGLDLKLLPYKVCPTELKAGFIECLIGEELDKLQGKEGISGVLDRELIVKHLRQQPNKDKDDLTEPLPIGTKFENFIQSLAGYCVATCVIGIGDRHPGNIMIKDNGIFFHIDFGHILGNFKYKFFFKRERTLFLLTPMMANVYSTENKEEFFKCSCVKAYNILRHNAQRLINMFIIMSTAGMPELCSMNDVKYVKKMLKLDMPNDEDAGNYFIGLIKQSKNDRFRLIDNIFHYLKHKK